MHGATQNGNREFRIVLELDARGVATVRLVRTRHVGQTRRNVSRWAETGTFRSNAASGDGRTPKKHMWGDRMSPPSHKTKEGGGSPSPLSRWQNRRLHHRLQPCLRLLRGR